MSPPQRSVSRWRRAAPLWSGLALLAYGGMAALGAARGPWSEHLGAFLVLDVLAWGAALGASRSGLSLGAALCGAALFRALLLPQGPSLSDDIYRYVWEGRVQNAGFDPYRLPPLAAELAPLRDAVWARVNHPEYSAIYPPLAELAFRGLARIGGVGAFKIAFSALDLSTCALLGWALRRRGAPTARLALYAWNPLAVVEVAGSGHLEPLGLLPLVAALVLVPRRRAAGWTLLATSAVSRYAALATVPAFVRAAPPRLGAILGAGALLAACFAPYAGARLHLFDSLRVYAQHWRYNALLFALVERAESGPDAARIGGLALAAVACILVAWWRRSLEYRALAALALALALAPTIHPWYLLWPLTLVPLAPSPAVLAWSGTIPLSYLFLYPAFGRGPLPQDAWALRVLEVSPVALAVAAAGWRSRAARSRAIEPASPPDSKEASTEAPARPGSRIVVVMPALDEEPSLPLVLGDLAPLWGAGARPATPAADVSEQRTPGTSFPPSAPRIDAVIVVDNGSRDRTPEIATAAGATLLREPQRGYGAACQRALGFLRHHPPEVVVFMDADRSDDAAEIPALLQPILAHGYDLVIGSRTLGQREPRALLPQARFGNWLATTWIRMRYGFRYTDLGPFRAVRWEALERLRMTDRDWGWTFEMQVRALQEGLRVVEVPVRYRKRVGRSKISGTVLGSARAGRKILATMWRLRGSGGRRGARDGGRGSDDGMRRRGPAS